MLWLIRLLILFRYFVINILANLLESVLLDWLPDLFHEPHESLAEDCIVFDQTDAILILLGEERTTLSLIFLYWISSDSISTVVMSMLFIWKMFLDIFLSCFSFFDSRWRVSSHVAYTLWTIDRLRGRATLSVRRAHRSFWLFWTDYKRY
jgi:hypothetical protein